MFSNLKKILSKISGKESDSVIPPSQSFVRTQAPPPAPKLPLNPPLAPAPNSPASDSISIPLVSVLVRLPEALKPKNNAAASPGVSILVPIQTITDQLQRGCVKISFKELKQAAPAGIFGESSNEDSALVELPIREIIPRINPACLKPRFEQKRIEVPPEILP